MKKSLLLFVLLATTFESTFSAYNTRDTAVERLTYHTGFRKSLKNGKLYTTVLAVPLTLGLTALTNTDKAGTFLSSIMSCAIVYGLLSALRSGHYYVARYYFKSIYNKRVDYHNNIVKAFTVGAQNLPYALNDQEFVQYGLAAGFALYELERLARKSGRIDLVRQLTEQIQAPYRTLNTKALQIYIQ